MKIIGKISLPSPLSVPNSNFGFYFSGIFRNSSDTISNQTVCCKEGAGLKNAYFKFAQHLANLSTRQHGQVQKMEILLGGFQLTFCTSIITRPCYSKSQKMRGQPPDPWFDCCYFALQKTERHQTLYEKNPFMNSSMAIEKNYVYIVKKRLRQYIGSITWLPIKCIQFLKDIVGFISQKGPYFIRYLPLYPIPYPVIVVRSYSEQ